MTTLDETAGEVRDEGPAAVVRPGRKRDHSRDPEILAAALDVLAECGYDGMTVDMVAARAKAGKATLYRRWPSKAELVLDAVACMKGGPADAAPPDTGSVRGDLVAMIRTPSIVDAERKLQIMAGVASLVARAPELGEAVRAAIVEPRVAANLEVFRRGVARGEVPEGRDLDTIAHVGAALAAHRVLIERQPVTREFLVAVIDGVVLPALGVPAEPGA